MSQNKNRPMGVTFQSQIKRNKWGGWNDIENYERMVQGAMIYPLNGKKLKDKTTDIEDEDESKPPKD